MLRIDGQEFPELKIWYDAVETTANFGWAMRGSMKKKTERRETEHAVLKQRYAGYVRVRLTGRSPERFLTCGRGSGLCCGICPVETRSIGFL